MKSTHISTTTVLTAMFACLCAMPMAAIAEEEESKTPATAPAAAERPLDLKGAKKETIRHSMIGITSTRVFYTLPEQKAVVVVHIDNATAAFPTTGTVVLFASDVTEEGISKWINNQHSCGLFVDPAEPVFTGKLPEDALTIIAREPVGPAENRPDQPPHMDFKVKVAVKAHQETGKYKLAAFEDEVGVFLKVEAL